MLVGGCRYMHVCVCVYVSVCVREISVCVYVSACVREKSVCVRKMCVCVCLYENSTSISCGTTE